MKDNIQLHSGKYRFLESRFHVKALRIKIGTNNRQHVGTRWRCRTSSGFRTLYSIRFLITLNIYFGRQNVLPLEVSPKKNAFHYSAFQILIKGNLRDKALCVPRAGVCLVEHLFVSGSF